MQTQSSREQILQMYAQGTRDFSGLEFGSVEINLGSCTLDNANFSGCFIVANFSKTSLKNAKFENANIKTCNFSGANLSHASFQGAAVDAANFSDANLENANFYGASEQGYFYAENEFPLRKKF